MWDDALPKIHNQIDWLRTIHAPLEVLRDQVTALRDGVSCTYRSAPGIEKSRITHHLFNKAIPLKRIH
jgi:hypothetical protein